MTGNDKCHGSKLKVGAGVRDYRARVMNGKDIKRLFVYMGNKLNIPTHHDYEI